MMSEREECDIFLNRKPSCFKLEECYPNLNPTSDYDLDRAITPSDFADLLNLDEDYQLDLPEISTNLSLEDIIPENFNFSFPWSKAEQYSDPGGAGVSASIQAEDSTDLAHQTLSLNQNFDGHTTEDSSSFSSMGLSSPCSSGLPSFSPTETSSAYSKKESRRQRMSLVGLNDDEKYQRIREQNNLASKAYRKRKKTSRKDVENQLQQLISQNKHLRECLQRLECDFEQCQRIKQMIERFGLGHIFSK